MSVSLIIMDFDNKAGTNLLALSSDDTLLSPGPVQNHGSHPSRDGIVHLCPSSNLAALTGTEIRSKSDGAGVYSNIRQ